MFVLGPLQIYAYSVPQDQHQIQGPPEVNALKMANEVRGPHPPKQ